MARAHRDPRTMLEYLIQQRDRTYEELADEFSKLDARATISARHLGRLARGERDMAGTTPATRRALQAMFGMSAVDLLRPWTPDLVPVAPVPSSGARALDDENTVVQMTSFSGEPDFVAIDRRTFMSGVAALPAVAWLGRGASSPPTVPTPVSDGNLADIVHNMAQLRLVLAAQDNILGPGAVAPTAIHQIDILQQLSRAATGKARGSLMSLQAAYAEFAGWLFDDLGNRRVGEYWTDRALEWAHEANNDLIIGYVLMRKAQQAAEKDDPASAISLAHSAQRMGAITPRVRAAAAQFEAQGHALHRDHGAFRDAIDRARELVVTAPAATPGDWAPWCTPTYVDIHEAGGWMRIGEPARAATVYEKALNDWSSEFQRDEGIYEGRLARAHAAAGHPEQATEVGRAALRIASRTGSARIIAELLPLSETLSEWRQLSSVRTFKAELDQTLIPAAAQALNRTDRA